MIPWTKAVQRYLTLRRGFGFKLEYPGQALADFACFLNRRAATHITVPLALQWARGQSPGHGAVHAAQRLSMVRGFARFCHADDPRTEIPPAQLLPFCAQRARPYLYSAREIRSLLAAALRLDPNDALRRWTYHGLFGLLAVSGLRLGEARGLRLGDIDWRAGVLTIRGTKFGQSRLVPLHPTTTKVLHAYYSRRSRYFGRHPTSDYLFVSKRGNRVDGGEARRVFYRISRQVGLRGATDSHGPRLHDFRHRFAVATLVRWYRTGVDPERQIQILSTYLGHIHVADTYWYLTLCPALRGAAIKRLEKRWSQFP
jgi:integrase